MSALADTPLAADAERLGQMQAEFAAGILGLRGAVLARIQESAPLDAAKRFGVYAEAYRARLKEALADTFGHTARYVGDDAFAELALAYIETHTPERASIRWYGETFPEWLRTAHPADAGVAELAALDWALRAAFDSADAVPLVAEDLARLGAEDWDRAGFVLHPAFRLLDMHHNTVALWHALDRDETPPPREALPQPATLLVWRRELQPHFRTVDADEARALRGLHGGSSFGSICARLSESRPQEDAAALAGRWLARWIDDALLVGLR
jgi:hypothetical protein